MKPLGVVFADTARIHNRFHHMVFESFGIYRGQPRLFFALHDEKEPINQTMLAKKMNISASTLTRMVQTLEKNGNGLPAHRRKGPETDADLPHGKGDAPRMKQIRSSLYRDGC